MVRLDITRTNRPQFKSTVTVLPEYFADGEIKIPMRGKLNAAFRDELLKKKTDIEAFIASLTAISMALPEEARTRKDILEVYEVVKSVNPAEISRTTIIAKKKEQTVANAELVRQLQEARRPGVLDFVRKRLEGMKNGTIKRKGNNYTKQTLHTYTGFANILETFIKQHPFDWEDINERLIDEFVLYMENYGYMKKTVNKNLAVFSAMLNTAFKEGFRFKTSVLDHFPKLHVTREDKVVEIYLTEEELQAVANTVKNESISQLAADKRMLTIFFSIFYSKLYSLIFRYNVRSDIFKSAAAFFRRPLCFSKALRIISFSTSSKDKVSSSTSSASWIVGCMA